jgi:ABC-type transporter Mla subunit MlaD
MTLSEMFRNLKFYTQDYTDSINKIAEAVDNLSAQLNQRMDEMATNLQQALASIRAEVEDERSVFIGAVKLFQSYADQVKQVGDSTQDQEVAQALNDLAIQMRENAGPLAAAIVANTPQAVPPMAPSPAVPSGSGDGVSATLPQDAGAGSAPDAGTSPSTTTSSGTPTTSPDTPPTDGQTRVDPSDASKLQVSADGKWYSEGETRTQDGKTFTLQNGSWVEQGAGASPPPGGARTATRR